MKAPFSCTTRCFCMVLWEGVEWEGTGEKAPQLASTPASCSKQAAQLSPGAAPPALCLLVFGPWLCLGPGMILMKMGWGCALVGST